MDFKNFLTLTLPFFVTICFVPRGTSVDPNAIDMKSKLRRDLLNKTKYDKITSPKRYFNHTEGEMMEIGITMIVLHVHSLDEVNGILTVNGWFFLSWVDPRLRWEPQEYQNIMTLHLEDKSVWMPDIMIYNNAESIQMDHYGNAALRLFRDGTVYWFPPATLRSTCPIDHKLYPFDEHECVISMGAWAYSSLGFTILQADKDHQLDVLAKYGTENPLWEVLDRQLSVQNLTYDCCPNSYYLKLEMKLQLRRRSPFHKFMLTVPSIFAVFLTLANLWLPPDADIKFTLGATVLVIEAALLIFLGWQIPPGGKSIPAIVYFCGNAFMLTAFSLIVAVVVRKLCSKVSSVPVEVMSVLRGPTGRILCLEPPNWDGWAHFISKVAHRDKLQEDQQHLDVGSGGGNINQVEFGGTSEDSPIANSNKVGGVQSDWFLVAVAVDRATFVIYCFLFFLVFVLSFV